MNKIPMLSLLIKILQNETVINADFEFAKNEAIKEMQDLKLDIVRLSGTRSIIEVSDVLLSVIGMIQGQRLNAQSLSAILGYLKHDVSLLESLENPSQLKVGSESFGRDEEAGPEETFQVETFSKYK